MPTSLPTRPRVFLDIQSESEFLGRIIIEIFSDKTPKTAENFRAICTPSSVQPLTYKGSPFHRIVNEFMIQGGDITAGNGTGGLSIYGPVFEDENIGWREIDAVGLVCMANRGKGTNSSQFFITLAPCQHLNAKHTVFGHVIKGTDVCQRMSKVSVDKRDRPLSEIIISDCGELHSNSRSSDAPPFSSRNQDRVRSQAGAMQGNEAKSLPSTSQPAKPRNYSRSQSGHRRHRNRSPPPRRRSDAGLDENRRGRTPTRSLSPQDHSSQSPQAKRRRHRRRSSPPSRSRSPKRSRSPHLRRRSTDRTRPPRFEDTRREGRDQGEHGRWNGHLHHHSPGHHSGDGYNSRQHPQDKHGDRRLGVSMLDRKDKYGGKSKDDNVVKFKGRGSMKYQEPKAW